MFKRSVKSSNYRFTQLDFLDSVPGHYSKPYWSLLNIINYIQMAILLKVASQGNSCHGCQHLYAFPLGYYQLANWGRVMHICVSNLTITGSNAFSWTKMYKFPLIFHCSFVPKCPINSNPALVQIMAWRRPGDKPLSEPMMISLLTYMRHSAPMS